MNCTNPIEQKYFFAVVATARSGNHLICSFLNSHPQFSIEIGHAGVVDPEEIEVAEKHGRSVHYTILKQLSQVKPERIIHLIRENEDALARSQVLCRILLSQKCPIHRREGQPVIDKAKVSIQKVKENIKVNRENRKNVRKHLTSLGIPVLEVTYEELTGGGDVVVCPQKVSSRIMEFLGGEDLPLRTSYRKV